ncbi:MAG: N4-gp56 family major capsid protein [Oscillospiraceae bacterium]|nr:N4-gp56 family major capsid protein [Oscillospiraceae bacterium]
METSYMNLRMFDNTNTTADTALSAEMRTYYSDYLIDNAGPELVHDQFGQRQAIPQNGGRTIEFRKYDPLEKALTPIAEGVTPSGKRLSVSTVPADVQQYGDYIEMSDVLMLTAIDNNLLQATKLLGAQAGQTLDTITREVLVGGTNVQYAEGQVTSRSALVGGSSTAEDNHYLTVDAVRQAVRFLKNQNAKPINGSFVGIIHPDVSYDLMNDPKWVNVKTYSDPDGIYEGEIGKIENVRFVETTEAKKFVGAGANGRDVYCTLVLGENAYGVTEVAGGGLQHIVKQVGSSGTADPLNQRATAGWKALKTAERLVEQFMVRIETTSTFSDGVAN